MTLCETNWVTDDITCTPCSGDYSLDPDQLGQMQESASELLFYWSAQQFTGECEVTVHPCSCSNLPGDYMVDNGILTVRGFSVFSACGCSRPSSCSCEHLSSVTLPLTPVTSITSVVTEEDGPLEPADYLLRGNVLYRVDGERWPLCDDDFLITYKYGVPIPISGRRAAAILACELYMACDPDAFEGKCRLPKSAISVVRQGVTVALKSALFTPRHGQPVAVGIEEIDMWLAAVNPFGLIAPSVILSADEPDYAELR